MRSAGRYTTASSEALEHFGDFRRLAACAQVRRTRGAVEAGKERVGRAVDTDRRSAERSGQVGQAAVQAHHAACVRKEGGERVECHGFRDDGLADGAADTL